MASIEDIPKWTTKAHEQCKCGYKLKSFISHSVSSFQKDENILKLDKADTIIKDNANVIKNHHSILCAVNQNTPSLLKVLNIAYINLMKNTYTFKEYDNRGKFVSKIVDHVYCVEHTDSFTIYTLPCYKSVLFEQLKHHDLFVDGTSQKVSDGTKLKSKSGRVHLTIFETGTVLIQGHIALFVGGLVREYVSSTVGPLLLDISIPLDTNPTSQYKKAHKIFNPVDHTVYIPPSEIETDVHNSSSISDAVSREETKGNNLSDDFSSFYGFQTSPTQSKCQGCVSHEHTISSILQRLEALEDENKVLRSLSENLKSMTQELRVVNDLQKSDRSYFNARLGKLENTMVAQSDRVVSDTSKVILDSITNQSEHETNESLSDLPIIPSSNTNKSSDNTPVDKEAQKITNNINKSTANAPVLLNRDQNISNHRTHEPNVTSPSIDNTITNNADNQLSPPKYNTNNPANVWNHALSPKVRENNVPSRHTNSNRVTKPPQSDPEFDRTCTVLIYDININHYKTLKKDCDIRKTIFQINRHIVIDTITRVGIKNPKLLVKLRTPQMADNLIKDWRSSCFTQSKVKINPISKGVTHTTTHGMVRGIPKHITDEEINRDLHLCYPQAKASRLISKQGPMNLVKVIFSSREELEHAIIHSLWLEDIGLNCSVEVAHRNITQCFNCWKYGHSSKICANTKICCNCGKDTPHDMINCTQRTQCSNCNMPHKANDKQCVKLLQLRSFLADN